ncbi:hypothetical protein F5X71_18350 [Nocardia brasiliensis]|uniref:Uncharacterized protein n=1 Tax=Nocardia brasiliensis TaxID=37326 RepID=A0A6G9XSZ3_NOCBR|nr:hypothetical protein [Nocardia brasiliensis]QIS04025.1 hypothetical protein F5X71_18350 [Nocardia brasiliensis]
MDSGAHRLAHDTQAEETPTRRVTVYFDGPTPEDALILEYAASNTEAWEFTSAALYAGLTVTVDGKVRPGLRRLPCRSLWH